MSIIADRGLFVRLPVQSGRFDAPGAESFADAVDAATREPATKDDIHEVRADIAALRADVSLLGQRSDAAEKRLDGKLDAAEKRLDARLDVLSDRLLLRLGGLLFVLLGLFFAALRLT